MPPSHSDSSAVNATSTSSPPTPTLPTTPTSDAAASASSFLQQPLFNEENSSNVNADDAAPNSNDDNSNNDNTETESPSANETDESNQQQHSSSDNGSDDTSDSGNDSLNEQTLSLSLNQQDNEQHKETVIVFDWDDTLLSSTFLASKGYRLDSDMTNVNPELLASLASLAASVCAVLRLAATYGRVHIITNAETGWVELSASKFIPSVVPVLQELNIAVFSARSTFECDHPDSPLKWKCSAFSSLLLPLLVDRSIFKNVLSFGDSHVEREAVRTVTLDCPNTLCKSVKFAERPTCEQLRRQIDLVINCMNYIQSSCDHLDLQLTVTVNEPQQQEDEEKEDKMRCPQPSSMPAHDDGCGGYVPSSNPNNYMTMDEEDDEQSVNSHNVNNLLSNDEQLQLQLDEDKAVEAY